MPGGLIQSRNRFRAAPPAPPPLDTPDFFVSLSCNQKGMNMSNAPRKTAKYYRNILTNGSTSQAVAILPEIIKKFGYKRWDKYSKHNDIINLRKYTEFEWNHRIESFYLNDKGKVCVDIYWQGDSTDGNDSLYADECMYGKTIRGVYEWIGDRTYEKHSDIRISAEEFRDAIKAVGKYLAPEEIKKRKEADRRYELSKQVYNFIDSQVKTKDEEFWNGRRGVQELLEKNQGLLDKTFDELKPIVLKVYNNNYHTSYWLRNGATGRVEYNLAY